MPIGIFGVSPGTAGVLPDQTGNSGEFLTTNGTNPSWATITIKEIKTAIATISAVTSPGNPGGSYLDVISATITGLTASKTYHISGIFSSDIYTGTAQNKPMRMLINGSDAGTQSLYVGTTSQTIGFTHSGALSVTGVTSCVVKLQYSATSSDNFNNNNLNQTLYAVAVEQ